MSKCPGSGLHHDGRYVSKLLLRISLVQPSITVLTHQQHGVGCTAQSIQPACSTLPHCASHSKVQHRPTPILKPAALSNTHVLNLVQDLIPASTGAYR